MIELLDRLAEQDYPNFEIIVVEQSESPALLARLEARRQPGLRVVATKPLGAPGARNEAVRHAANEILLMVDDDDLPVGSEWIKKHVANFADPLCLAVNGRLSSRPDGVQAPRFPRLVKALSFRYTFLKNPRTYAYGSLRKIDIAFLIGSNVSVRRALVERVGGWDEGVPMGEEQSFAFRYALQKRPDEYFVYDPLPTIWRRVDIDGGLDRRSRPDWYENELHGHVVYYHGVVGFYYPWRFRLLYPLVPLTCALQVLEWIWDPDNRARGVLERLRASFGVFVSLPKTIWRSGVRMPRRSIRRMFTVR